MINSGSRSQEDKDRDDAEQKSTSRERCEQEVPSRRYLITRNITHLIRSRPVPPKSRGISIPLYATGLPAVGGGPTPVLSKVSLSAAADQRFAWPMVRGQPIVFFESTAHPSDRTSKTDKEWRCHRRPAGSDHTKRIYSAMGESNVSWVGADHPPAWGRSGSKALPLVASTPTFAYITSSSPLATASQYDRRNANTCIDCA